MAINVDAVRNWTFEPVDVHYSERDSIFYALSLGVGQDPLDPAQLRFVYERGLEAAPTMAVVLGHPGSFLADPRSGVDYGHVVHGEQHLEIFAPLPASGALRCTNTVDELLDKGPGKGALISVTRTLTNLADGMPLARSRGVLFARADGGFGGPSTSGHDALAACPDRAPDASITWPTFASQALIYRLNGDMNPLHADPAVAGKAGFRAPILHGLASFGIAGMAAIRQFCDGGSADLVSLGMRFSSPIYPGETFRIDFWKLGQGRAALRGHAVERDVVVLNNGLVTWTEQG